MAKRFVLKEFKFLEKTEDGAPKEHIFKPGFQDIPDEFMRHPYLGKHNADGALEPLNVTREKAAAAEEAAEETVKLHRKIKDDALASLARALGRPLEEVKAEAAKGEAEKAAAEKRAADEKAAAEKEAAKKEKGK